MVRIGDLNRLITFQKLTKVSDGAGGFTELWADDFSVWASLQPNSYKTDMYENGVAVNKQGYDCIFLWNEATPTIKHRVHYSYDGIDKYLQVRTIKEDKDSRIFWFITLTDTRQA